MSRWVILSVVVVGLTATATFLSHYLPDSETALRVPVNTSTGPQPKLEIDQEPIYTFGKMSQYEAGKHTWQIKNNGQGNLEIWMEGKPTCSCTIAKLENNQKAMVKPGESTTIDLEWNTKDFQDSYSQGAVFGTNDPSRPIFRLTVAGKVYPAVIVFPQPTIQFASIDNEETHKSRIAVFSPDRPQMKLTKVSTSKPGLIVAHMTPMAPAEAKKLKVDAGHEVIVEIKPGMALGQFHEELIIETDHPKEPRLKVTVAGKVKGPITVVPEGLRMSNVAGLRGASGEITLLVRGGQETHFEVDHKPAKLEVIITRDDTPTMKGRYRMTVQVPAGTPAGPVHDEIVLRTDHPKVSELKIPVNILVSHSGPG
jgi:hypothetical protein